MHKFLKRHFTIFRRVQNWVEWYAILKNRIFKETPYANNDSVTENLNHIVPMSEYTQICSTCLGKMHLLHNHEKILLHTPSSKIKRKSGMESYNPKYQNNLWKLNDFELFCKINKLLLLFYFFWWTVSKKNVNSVRE